MKKIKKAACASLALALLLPIIPTGTGAISSATPSVAYAAEASETIAFKDQRLKDAIKKELKLDSDEVTSQDLEKLVTLTLSKADIKDASTINDPEAKPLDLGGLEYATNLEKLTIDYVGTTNNDTIRSLKKLQTLVVDGDIQSAEKRDPEIYKKEGDKGQIAEGKTLFDLAILKDLPNLSTFKATNSNIAGISNFSILDVKDVPKLKYVEIHDDASDKFDFGNLILDDLKITNTSAKEIVGGNSEELLDPVNPIEKEFKVTFDANGAEGKIDEKTVKENTEFSLPENTFKAPEGKVFSHWEVDGKAYSPTNNLLITKDTVVKAIWVDEVLPELSEFKIAFNNGEAEGEMESVIVLEGDSYTLPENLFTAPKDKTFSHWLVNGEVRYPGEVIDEVTSDLDITPVFEDITKPVIKHEITFDPNGGSGEDVILSHDESIEYILPENLFTAPENKEFSHWDVDGRVLKPGDSIIVNKDTTIKAMWKDIEEDPKEETSEYRIIFNANGGIGIKESITVKEDSEYELPTNPFTAPKDKEFSHWDVDGEKYQPGDKIVIKKDTSVKAIWKDVEKELQNFKVTFNANGGEGAMDPITIKEDTQYTLPENKFVAPKDKEFSHWDVDGRVLKPGDKIIIKDNTVIKAIWKDIEKKPTPIDKVSISFDANGGVGIKEPVTVDKGSKYKLPSNPFTAPKNKAFSHWEVNGEKYQVGAEITVNIKTIVKAVWKDLNADDKANDVMKYTISLDPNGGEGMREPITIEENEVYTLPENKFTAPEGKEFDHWEIDGGSYKPGDQVTISKDTIIKAIWKDKNTDKSPADEKGRNSSTVIEASKDKGKNANSNKDVKTLAKDSKASTGGKGNSKLPMTGEQIFTYLASAGAIVAGIFGIKRNKDEKEEK